MKDSNPIFRQPEPSAGLSDRERSERVKIFGVMGRFLAPLVSRRHPPSGESIKARSEYLSGGIVRPLLLSGQFDEKRQRVVGP
jgi:hypothetical protein